jgi:HK97 family phage major capsid protein
VNEKMKRIQAELTSLVKETQPLAEKSKAGSLTDEESTQFDGLVEQIQKAQGDFAAEEKRYNAAVSLDDTFAQYGKPADTTKRTPANGEPQRAKSFAQQFTESDAVKRYMGDGRSLPFDVGSFYAKHKTSHRDGMGPDEVRALIQTGNLPADYIAPTMVPGFFRGDDLQGTLRDVLINGTTNSDAILFFRELAFTNNAAGVPQATNTSAASETPVNASVKPESAITYEQATAPVVTIAHWIPITRQTLQDAAQLQTYVEQRLLDGLRLEESDQLLNGNGTNDLTGLLNTADVQDLDQTYFTGAAVNDAGLDNENYNRILRAKTLIRTVGRARANFVVINPADHEDLLTASTASDHQYYGAGPFSGNGVTNLCGLRVVEDENLTEGSVLVGDGRMAAVWDRMQAQIFIDTIDDQFIRNMLTILAEERLALTVFRPQAFAVVDLA